MCDITVWVVKDEAREKVMENVDLIEEIDGGMRLVNIFGEERTLPARLVRFDNSSKQMVFRESAPKMQ